MQNQSPPHPIAMPDETHLFTNFLVIKLIDPKMNISHKY